MDRASQPARLLGQCIARSPGESTRQRSNSLTGQVAQLGKAERLTREEAAIEVHHAWQVPGIVTGAANRRATARVRRYDTGIIMNADTIQHVGGTGSCHLSHIAIVIATIGRAALEEACGCRRAADHQRTRIGTLDGVIGGAKHLCVIRAIDRAGGPFAVDIHLVPDFDGICAATGQAGQEIGETLIISTGICGDLCRFADNAQQHFESAAVGAIDEILVVA